VALEKVIFLTEHCKN